ncbi:BID domain-containing T4SS effector [Bartonella sp. AR 15-3]|uniref:BID domain-containing T4SS effector n=1 Tax=Bartonella sp. AR 15-3 TaxID=545617 RepID=UPI0009991DC6|nr:BID domain-containing T4SS effector [Bartonella sp. AR 15-3]OPB31283.1 Bartonella effector protein Bep10 [Bartonella sp. AR 15-3]
MSIRDSEAFKKVEQSLLQQSSNYTYANSGSGNSNTLKNKFGIQDYKNFQIKCAHAVAKEIVNVYQEPAPEKFDHSYLKQLHKRLFKKVFDWAGETRDASVKMSDGTIANMVTTSQNPLFASNNDIKKCLEEFNEKLAQRKKSQDTLQEKPEEKLTDSLTTVYALLNHARPFVDGNGVTQRLFMNKLSQAEDQKLDFSVVTQKRMEDAIVNAANDNLAPMKHLFEDASDPQKIQTLKTALTGMNSGDIEDLTQGIVTTPIPGKVYTGVYESRQLDTIVIKTQNSVIVCNKYDIPREEFQKLRLGDTVSFKALNNLDDVLIPGRELSDLTNFKVMEKTFYTPSVQQQRKEVERLARLVFGNRETLSNYLERVHENPSSATMLANRIVYAHKSISKLAGFGAYGINSPKRNRAEKNLIALSEAVRKYGDCLKSSKEEVLQEHRQEQYRIAKDVHLPSKDLARFLNMSPDERGKLPITEAATLSKEAAQFLKQIYSRLSADEQKMVNNNDHKSFAKSIGIPENKAQQVMETVKQVKAIQEPTNVIKPLMKHSPNKQWL